MSLDNDTYTDGQWAVWKCLIFSSLVAFLGAEPIGQSMS